MFGPSDVTTISIGKTSLPLESQSLSFNTKKKRIPFHCFRFESFSTLFQESVLSFCGVGWCLLTFILCRSVRLAINFCKELVMSHKYRPFSSVLEVPVFYFRCRLDRILSNCRSAFVVYAIKIHCKWWPSNGDL